MFGKKKKATKYLLVDSSELKRYDGEEMKPTDASKYFEFYEIPDEYRKVVIEFTYPYGMLEVFDYICNIKYDVPRHTRINKNLDYQIFKGVSCKNSLHSSTSFEKIVTESSFVFDEDINAFFNQMDKDGLVNKYINALRSFYDKEPIMDFGNKRVLKNEYL